MEPTAVSHTPIFKALEALPSSNLTTKSLSLLDMLVRSDWKNINSFEQMIREVTGEDDKGYLQEIGQRAIALYEDPSQSYQRAMKLYHLVDDLDKVAGAAAMANLIGGKFSFLSFMEKLTPRDETTQAIDAGAKFVAELATFCLINGIPGDSVKDFVRSLTSYAGDDLMRIAAWIAYDGVLPLGPNFMSLVIDRIDKADDATLTSNPLISKLTAWLPGDGIAARKHLILESLSGAKGWVDGFLSSKGITQDAVVSKLRGIVDVTDTRLDYIAAAIDVGTNYFEHTGTQSIARQAISRAYGEV